MGMYDTIRCSYPIVNHYNSEPVQTKSLSCELSLYWISPNGELFEVTGNELEDQDVWNPEFFTSGIIGTNGKVKPFYYTGVVTLYPSRGSKKVFWEGDPRCDIFFKEGKVIETVVV